MPAFGDISSKASCDIVNKRARNLYCQRKSVLAIPAYVVVHGWQLTNTKMKWKNNCFCHFDTCQEDTGCNLAHPKVQMCISS